MKNKQQVLNRVVVLQESITRGLSQKRVTISKDFCDSLGWKKGDKIHITMILGSGMVCMEKEERSGDANGEGK